jgi:lipopolysaccharide export system protein LptA
VRFTIERLRTVVLAAGVLLVVALVVFLALGKWRNPLNLKELPGRLGLGIQQDATGYTMEHSFGAHSRYKIHASKVVEYSQGRAVLHDVKIELFGEDGSRVDRIEGNEFEYDKNSQKATATGLAEITLMRPGVAPAIAPKASASKVKQSAKSGTLATAAQTAAQGEIHVRTTGLVFDQKSGLATTDQHVDFSMIQGSGSSVGASYDSKQGYLVLDRAVELNAERGGQPVQIHAQHAEFERDEKTCHLHVATADYRGGEATAGNAKILFREDGSAVRLDAVDGFTLNTATGSHIAAPTGSMDFNEHNQPRHGHLEGGVKMDSVSQTAGRRRLMHGSSPAADLEFTPQGELRHLHMARGVDLHSEDLTETAKGVLRESRTWTSPLADVEFRDNGKGQAEPATIHGIEGVVVTGQKQLGREAPEPSRLAADEVTGEFGPGSQLTAMNGNGHASTEETSTTGTREYATGDRLEAHFAPAAGAQPNAPAKREQSGASQVQSAVLDGHVVLIQTPAAKPDAETAAPMRATAGRAVYEGTGEWLHLTLSPRVEDGGLQLTADKIDVTRESGDAFAHGNVKATWQDSGAPTEVRPASGANGQAGQGSVTLGGQGPSHVISNEAQLHQVTGEATFRGHARLWQQANSVTAPVIVLDRQRETMVARSTDPAEPVRAVLLSEGGLESGKPPAGGAGQNTGKDSAGKSSSPSVIRVHGGDLKYSDAEHTAVMRAGALGPVVAETGAATTASNELDLLLLPAGNHAGKDGGEARVDRMTAKGHVTVTSDDRRGTGEQLVYSSQTGEYVLTGSTAALPKMYDRARGTVSGEALIFHSRDDSVSVEGGGRKTTTETRSPK